MQQIVCDGYANCLQNMRYSGLKDQNVQMEVLR